MVAGPVPLSAPRSAFTCFQMGLVSFILRFLQIFVSTVADAILCALR